MDITFVACRERSPRCCGAPRRRRAARCCLAGAYERRLYTTTGIWLFALLRCQRGAARHACIVPARLMRRPRRRRSLFVYGVRAGAPRALRA